jgi:hypothetical protein
MTPPWGSRERRFPRTSSQFRFGERVFPEMPTSSSLGEAAFPATCVSPRFGESVFPRIIARQCCEGHAEEDECNSS